MISTFSPPPDGWTYTEKMIMREVVITLYARLPDLADRFIIMATFEANYTQDEIGRMIGVSQVAVQKRLRKAQRLLKDLHIQGKL